MADLEIIKDHLIDMNPAAEEAGTGYMSPEAEQKQNDAIAAAKAGETPAEEVKPEEPAKEPEKVEAKPEEKPEAKPDKADDEPTPADTPVEYKRVITREKNRRKTVEDALAATQAQLNQALTALNRYIPDPNAVKPEPRADSFADTDQYIEARSEWLAEQKMQARTAEQNRKEQETKAQAAQREYMDRLEAAEDAIPGITDLAKDPTLPVSPAMGAFIVKQKEPAKILKWLDEHRDDAKRLASSDPVDAVAELGEIRASLNAKPPPKVSSAPKPIAPLAGSGKGGTMRDMYDPQATDEEWAAGMAAKQAARLAELRGQSPK